MRQIIIAASLALLVLALRIYPQEPAKESPGPETAAQDTIKENASWPAAFFLIKCQDCTDQEKQQIETAFREKAGAIPKAALFTADDMKDQAQPDQIAPACATKSCALETAKHAGAQKIIIAAARKRIEEKEVPLGTEGKGKYLVEVRRTVYFDLTAELHDAEKGSLDINTAATAGKDMVDESIEMMMQKLAPYFEMTRPDTTAPDIIEETAQPEKKDQEAPLRFTPFASLYFSAAVPAGKFSDLAGSGYGFAMDAGVRDMLMDNTTIRATLSYHYMITAHEDLDTLSMLKFGVQGGYTFHLYDDIYLTPLLGFGYLIHFTTGKTSGETEASSRTYSDPSMEIQAELGYRLTNGIELTLTPGYLVFFETDNTGMAFTVNAGGRYYFH